MYQYLFFNRILQYLFFSACGFLFFTLPIHASVSYTVSPLVINIDSEARDIVTKTITISNTGTQQVTIYPTVNNITLSEGGGIETFLAPVESDRTQSLASWIEINRLGIDLQPGATRTIPFTIRVNPSPVPGTYHVLLGFGSGGNRDEAEMHVKNGQAPGTIVSVTIADKKISTLKLSNFFVDNFVTRQDNHSATFTFNNPGDEALVPTGEIIFYNTTGKEIGSVPVNNQNETIAPGAEHVFTATVPTDGLFGKYKAYLRVEYGTTTQRASLQDTSFYYVIPIKIILGIIIFLIVFVIVIAWYIHKRYFDIQVTEDAEQLSLHVKEGISNEMHHDINLKKIHD